MSRRRPFGSVRAKATLGATLVVAVALLAAGVAVLLALRSNLGGQADAEADAAARRVASQIAAGTPYAELELPDAEDHPVQVVDRDGRVLAVSEDLEAISGTGVPGVTPAPSPGTDRDDDDDADDPEAGSVGATTWHGEGRATVDGEAATYRFSQVEATDPRDETVLVYAGASLAGRQSTVGTAAVVMLAGLPLLLGVVAGVTWLVTRRALRPVEDIRREMAAITASADLSRRVPEPVSRDEIARLARTTNETLAALESSVERQRRFVADASHELRSPIASLRTQLEVAAAHPDLLDLPGAVEDTVRLQHLAADLLLLARLDAGERPGDGRVDLGELLAGEAARRTGDRIGVRAEADPGAVVAGSRQQLARVIGNLLDNAQRHADARITASVRVTADGVLLCVDDDGPGVPEAERDRVFERFVRLDDARSRDDGGAGLGLAIARDVARRHGGDLTAGQAPGGGARFTLRLPPAEAGSS
ncbi:HAMP domain-containing sensor histidine kinase [Streptomyces sp. NPDC018338]|uniref:sensor histidine kinase n=1 Tax=Streptomyces sp. NPDC018338 TaxID=3157192 RepID=UPI0033E06838